MVLVGIRVREGRSMAGKGKIEVQRGRRGNGDDLSMWVEMERAESFRFGQGKGKDLVGWRGRRG